MLLIYILLVLYMNGEVTYKGSRGNESVRG